MEIKIVVMAYNTPTPQDLLPVVVGKFTMVARDPVANKAVRINRLKTSSAEEEKEYIEGHEGQILKKQAAALSLQPPSGSELNHIHSVFLASEKGENVLDNCVRMSSTRLSSLHICHPQQKNVHGKIFGGFLLRAGSELAWATAFNFTKSPPALLSLDDITFVRPVSIGSLLSLNSVVSFATADGRSLSVSVNAEVIDPVMNTKERTNTFHFTFCSPDKSILPVMKNVLPITYSEAVLYVNAKNRYMRGRDIASRLGSQVLEYW